MRWNSWLEKPEVGLGEMMCIVWAIDFLGNYFRIVAQKGLPSA
jgi:hypothetical protein